MKILPPANIDEFERIPEEQLRKRYAVTQAPSLGHILKMADEWRAAGCTPAFLIVNDEPTIIACVSEESFGKFIN